MSTVVATRPEGDPESFNEETIYQELIRCSDPEIGGRYGFLYWLVNYVRIFNNDSRRWIPFVPWTSRRARELGYDDQVTLIIKMQEENKLISLKARQIGLTTLVILYYLYDGLFHPIALILLLSKGEKEAKELLRRTKAIYRALPSWMKPERVIVDTKTEWRLSNGSSVYSLTTKSGDSYSATHCLVDEAALMHRANTSLSQVLLNVEPTVGQNGKLFVISKIDKTRPMSTFSTMYRGALRGDSEYTPAFVPYYVVPGRDEKWYEQKKLVSLSIDGTYDTLYESYPKTPEEALMPKSSDKRLAYKWIKECYRPMDPLDNDELDIPGLRIYKEPEPNKEYLVVGDPSEGLAVSDPSSITVLSIEEKEQVAAFSKAVEPATLGDYMDKLSGYYNNARVIFELNQHGRALELWLKDNTQRYLVRGYARTEKQRKTGWDQNSMTKPLMYDITADELLKGSCIIHDEETYFELASIQQSNLEAPKGQHDDMATTFAIGLATIKLCIQTKFEYELYDLP